MHFNDVLGVTASILIMSSGGNLSDYLSSGELEKCSSTGVYSVLAHSTNCREYSIAKPTSNYFGTS